MNKDEILAKSRAENRNKDVYEQEVITQASQKAVVVQMALATLFFAIQIIAYTILVFVMSGCYIYDLSVSSTIL